ncbi:ATP-binding protein [Streptomyces sp. NPDC006997]|uniref:ATP-binding protein n=1 Tax=Streptomyces sp. NPDC006997 TaxID=3155356 RepID=UPI0033CF0567
MTAFTTRRHGPSPAPAGVEDGTATGASAQRTPAAEPAAAGEEVHLHSTVPARPSWATAVRRTVSEHLADLRLHPELLDNAVLMADELFANAVRHAGHGPDDTVTISIDATEHTLRVSVADGSPVPPRSRSASETAESGRGLAIVSALADDWGVAPPDPGTPGKKVWFALERPGAFL